jgi:hypothetical protein
LNTNSLQEKPRLVSAGQGFSILNTVEYRGRLLYSKYSPDRAVKSTIANLQLLPGTLVVVCSPCLWYGLDELGASLPQDCMICAVEADEALFELAKKVLSTKVLAGNTVVADKVTLLPLFNRDVPSQPDLREVDSFLQQHSSDGMLRRAIRVDFSAGTSFAVQLYETVCSGAEDTIAQFWKNRLTLVKLGRLYARNIMRNLFSLARNTTLEANEHTISRPIIICGAGESLNHTLSYLSALKKKNTHSGIFFILATDASLPILASYGIQADGVVGVESQAAIEKAYIGSCGTKCTLFADLTSRPQIQDILGGKTVWFATKYAHAHYLDRLEKDGIISSFIPPLGSVGLAAVYLALKIRRSERVPIFITGLDFSFSCGATHAKGAPAHLARLSASSRTTPVENYDASFREGTVTITGKDNHKIKTDAIMQSYAENFRMQFGNAVNVFDCGTSGIDIGLPRAADEALAQCMCKNEKQADVFTTEYEPAVDKAIQDSLREKVLRYYEKERRALEALRDLLMNGNTSEYRDVSITLDEQLVNLLKERDYLYLHFPDGYKLSCDIGFLKRVRAEIDFFLKDIDFALREHTLC